tara:strand:- start:9853 stop:11673 length:1821 start_codon:yes stop_codon:yes gene_type:complete
MCGIIGFISKEPNEDKIKKATELISHRGPDYQNYSIVKMNNRFLHLGSSRLSIRGSESENMPMIDEEGNQIVYNGEIFDMEKIYKILGINKPFQSDTRLLFEYLKRMKSYSEIKNLNAMFSFAFYDQMNEELIISIDKLGIKPLFYKFENDNFFFSSEMKSLVSITKQNNTSKEAISKLIYLGGNHYDDEFIENMHPIKPGEFIKIDSNLKIKKEKYFEKFNPNPQNNINFFEEVFPKIVDDHLQADLPVSLFLSGGIDSSLLAYYTKMKLGKNLNHFSVGFSESSFDESNSFNKVSKTLNLNKEEFVFPSSEIDSLIEDSINNMNNIVLDSSFVPTYYLCKKTSDHTKAVISGDGADELFGGYEWYRGLKYWKIIPLPIKKVISDFLSKINFGGSNSYLNFRNKLSFFFKFIVSDPYIQMLIWQSPSVKFDNKSIDLLSSRLQKYINKDLDFYDNLRNIDIGLYLYSNILPKVDTASMSVGLEVRPIFLDDRVVEYAVSLENSKNLNYLKNKIPLRKEIAKTSLDFLNKEKKHGFQFPLLNWYENIGKDYINNLYKSEYFDLYKSFFNEEGPQIYKQTDSNVLRLYWSVFVTNEWIIKNNLDIKN